MVMRCLARVAFVTVFGFVATAAPCSFANGAGGGGGHGGSGGHGFGGHSGHSGGRSSAGSSSGHSAFHSIGRPFGRIFGRHSNQPASLQQPSSATNPRNSFHSLNADLMFQPTQRRPHSSSFPRIHSRRSSGFFRFRDRFGFGGCSAFSGFGNGFFFGNRFNCFDDGFFFDPFFSGGFWGSSFYEPWFGDPVWFGSDSAAPPTNQPDSDPGSLDYEMNAQLEEDSTNYGAPIGLPQSDYQNVTLLQLRDGSMYGLTDYWVEGDDLHYKTTYGGQNSVPLDRIDFESTFKLNADRGVQFLLQPRATAP